MSAAAVESTPALEQARMFAAIGWRPFPCEYGGKRPAVGIKWGTATASAPADKTLQWWFGREPVNVGIAAKGSNLVILDEDVLGGMERLCGDYGRPVPKTYRVRTAKGWHWYFTAPSDYEIGNAPGILSQYGFDVRGGKGDGGYVIAAGSLHESGHIYEAEDSDHGTLELPEWLCELLIPDEESVPVEPASQGEPSPDRRYTMEQAQSYVRECALDKLRAATDGRRNDTLNNAALVVGHFVPTFWSEESAVESLTEEAERIGLDQREIGPTIRSGLRKGMTQPYTLVEAGPFASASGSSATESDACKSWSPIDLTAYLDGTVTQAETSVGARRKDGLRFFYPGLEHAVIGETEGGKTWFLLASAAAELVAGNRVVYIHFEENSPQSTVTRLHRQFRVPRQRIADDFLFLGPEHPVPPGRIEEMCAEKVPALVVLDGQNEAMALHAQKINDPDGAADFRRRLVKPWTRHGAAVASADHVVKDPSQNGAGYALGSVHKLNGLSGAGFLIESREAFGEGMKGNSGIYVVKDRPGRLRKAGKPTSVARKFHLAEMVIDDAGDQWGFTLHAPKTDDGPDPEFEQMREDRRQLQLDDEVFEVTAGLVGKGLDVSRSMVHANFGKNRQEVFKSLHRLEAQGRIVNIAYGQAARYDLPNKPVQTSDSES